VCVYLEFDYASGDSRPGGNVGTFNQLYPTAHSNLGYIDYIGRQNIISPSAGFTMSPARDLTLSSSNISSGEPRTTTLSSSERPVRPRTAISCTARSSTPSKHSSWRYSDE